MNGSTGLGDALLHGEPQGLYADLLDYYVQCSRVRGGCALCTSRRLCVAEWDALVERGTACQLVRKLKAFTRLTAGEQSLYSREEHLSQSPHKAHRQRQQDDPLEQPALRAVQEAVIP